MQMIVEWLVAVLVVARISRFGAEDILAEPFRAWVLRSSKKRPGPEQSMIGRGVFCRWCWGVWAATPVVLVWWLISGGSQVWDRWYVTVPALILATAQAAALVERWEPED